MPTTLDLTAERQKRSRGGTVVAMLDAARRSIRHRNFAEAARLLGEAERIGGVTEEIAALWALMETEQIEASATAGIDPFLRPTTVYHIAGLGRTAIWKRVCDGTFPAPVSLGGGRIAWRQSDIRKWQDERPTVSYAPQTAA